jgi:hypothetical protein
MDIAIKITLVFHLLGFASIMAGTLGQIKSFKNGAVVLPSILHGAWLSLATGLALAGLLPANGDEVKNLVISLKTASLTAIFFIAYTFKKKQAPPKWVVPLIMALTITNLSLAVVL